MGETCMRLHGGPCDGVMVPYKDEAEQHVITITNAMGVPYRRAYYDKNGNFTGDQKIGRG